MRDEHGEEDICQPSTRLSWSKDDKTKNSRRVDTAFGLVFIYSFVVSNEVARKCSSTEEGSPSFLCRYGTGSCCSQKVARVACRHKSECSR